jgi:predicted MFS family arabinose efflux permease
VNVILISGMLQSSLRLYRQAYSGLSRPIWWLSLVIFVNRSGTMVIPFLTVYLTLKGYSITQAGMIMGIFGLGAITGGYLGGWLTDKFGSFHVQFFSLFFNGVLFIILGYMVELWQIGLLVFLLSSIGEAFRPANAAAIAAYSNPVNRTRSYSLNRLAINLGWSIGPAVGGMLAATSYKLLFWADGITCIAASFILLITLSESRKENNAKQQPVVKQVAANVYQDRTFLSAMFFIILIGISFFQLFSIIPLYYREHVHLGVKAIGWVLASNGLVISLIEMVLVYKLENRKKALDYMFFGALLMGFSFLILTADPVIGVVVISMLFITFGEMLLFPFTNNFWVGRTNAANRGRYAAVYTMSFAVAHVVSPLLASFIAGKMGFNMLFIFDFLLCTIAAFGFLSIARNNL